MRTMPSPTASRALLTAALSATVALVGAGGDAEPEQRDNPARGARQQQPDNVHRAPLATTRPRRTG